MAEDSKKHGLRSVWDDEMWCAHAAETLETETAEDVLPVIRVPLAELIDPKPEQVSKEDWS